MKHRLWKYETDTGNNLKKKKKNVITSVGIDFGHRYWYGHTFVQTYLKNWIWGNNKNIEFHIEKEEKDKECEPKGKPTDPINLK